MVWSKRYTFGHKPGIAPPLGRSASRQQHCGAELSAEPESGQTTAVARTSEDPLAGWVVSLLATATGLHGHPHPELFIILEVGRGSKPGIDLINNVKILEQEVAPLGF